MQDVSGRLYCTSLILNFFELITAGFAVVKTKPHYRHSMHNVLCNDSLMQDFFP